MPISMHDLDERLQKLELELKLLRGHVAATDFCLLHAVSCLPPEKRQEVAAFLEKGPRDMWVGGEPLPEPTSDACGKAAKQLAAFIREMP